MAICYLDVNNIYNSYTMPRGGISWHYLEEAFASL